MNSALFPSIEEFHVQRLKFPALFKTPRSQLSPRSSRNCRPRIATLVNTLESQLGIIVRFPIYPYSSGEELTKVSGDVSQDSGENDCTKFLELIISTILIIYNNTQLELTERLRSFVDLRFVLFCARRERSYTWDSGKAPSGK